MLFSRPQPRGSSVHVAQGTPADICMCPKRAGEQLPWGSQALDREPQGIASNGPVPHLPTGLSSIQPRSAMPRVPLSQLHLASRDPPPFPPLGPHSFPAFWADNCRLRSLCCLGLSLSTESFYLFKCCVLMPSPLFPPQPLQGKEMLSKHSILWENNTWWERHYE